MNYKRIVQIAVITLIVLIMAVRPVLAAPINGGDSSESFAPGEILVKFKPNASSAEIAQIHRQYGGQVKETIPSLGVQVVTIPTGKVIEKARAYVANRKVLYVEPNYLCEVIGTPDDTYFAKQWGLNKVQAPQAWDATKGSSSVKIAILDTGVDLDHPDLSGKILDVINFTSSTTTDDVYGHGSHVAGIAAATTNNGIGVAGLGYFSSIVNVKVLGDNGRGYYSWIAKGIIWAADYGAQVINLSLGGSYASSTLRDAVNYAWSKGVIVVAAAGNNGNSTPFYPAYYSNSIAVAATDANDNLASWSNRGEWVDLAAPGVSIYSTLKDSGYGYKSGTSMATPHTSGLAALVFTVVVDSNGNGLLNDEVRSRIEAGADNTGLSGIGWGRINAFKAVSGSSSAPGSITGKVADAASKTPIAGATVSDGERSTLTDSSGGYTITNVPQGTYTVTASATGYDSASLTVTVTAGLTSTADFALPPIPTTGTITGKVTDAASKTPIAGATVSDGERSTLTDSYGRYTITNVPQGTYTVTASATGYDSTSEMVSVVSGQTATVDFILTKLELPAKSMWVDSIVFKVAGKNLRLYIKVASDSGAVVGSQVQVELVRNGSQSWTLSGTSDSSGTASFMVHKAPSGQYVATVTSLTASGFNWDTNQGMLEASYTLNRRANRNK